jgi:hypothetical protein
MTVTVLTSDTCYVTRQDFASVGWRLPFRLSLYIDRCILDTFFIHIRSPVYVIIRKSEISSTHAAEIYHLSGDCGHRCQYTEGKEGFETSRCVMFEFLLLSR